MKDFEHIQELIREMAEDLNENGLSQYANSLLTSSNQLDNPDMVVDTLSSIEGSCHIKAYGDLFLETLPGYEWPNKVSKLGNMCRKKRNKILDTR